MKSKNRFLACGSFVSFVAGLALLGVVMFAQGAAAATFPLYMSGTGSSNVTIAGDAGTTNLKDGYTTSNALSTTTPKYRTLFSLTSPASATTRMSGSGATKNNWYLLGTVYFNTSYASTIDISAAVMATIYASSTSTSDQFRFVLVDYDPASGAGARGTAITTSNQYASPGTGTTPKLVNNAAVSLKNSLYTLPQGHLLAVEIQYYPASNGNTGYVYCNSGGLSKIDVEMRAKIVSTTSANGTISGPATTPGTAYFNVNPATNATYTMTANSGYMIKVLTVDGSPVGAAANTTSYTYTFSNIIKNHTIDVSYQSTTVNLTITTGSGGTTTLPAYGLSWSGGTTQTYSVSGSGTLNFTVTPDAGYGISSVFVDGVDQGVPAGQTTAYSFPVPVSAGSSHTISTTFIRYYTITSSAGTGGTIDPLGTTNVLNGGALTFDVTPDAGYRILAITDNGLNVGNTTPYSLTNVTANHTIVATFQRYYTITATAGSNGSISPIGNVLVDSGTSRNFSLSANFGFKVADVKIDGVSVDPVTTYTFSNVAADHTIVVTFETSPLPTTYCAKPPFITIAPPPNVMLMLSVETPMQGPAHVTTSCSGIASTFAYTCSATTGGCNNGALGCYDNARDYTGGYFDSGKCYTYDAANNYFKPSGAAINPVAAGATPHQCAAGTAWSGNMLNWGTMMAVDAFRKSYTGGNRDVDTATDTVILAARHDSSWFPDPVYLDKNAEMYMPITGANQTRYFKRAGTGMGFVLCNSGQTDCSFSTTGSGETRFPVAGSNAQAAYRLRIKACDATGGVETRCNATNNKPEGVIQKNMNNIRFGLISYAADNDQQRDGGVLRSVMKWVNPTISYGMQYYDSSGAVATCLTSTGCKNPEAEVCPGSITDSTDPCYNKPPGGFAGNPAKATGANSGVINYINKFAYASSYKSYDPMGEMYYEVVRYFMNLTPSVNKYCSGLTDFTAGYADGFAFHCNASKTNQWGWRKPDLYACSQNFVIAINDANPWLDKRVPGSAFKASYGGSAASGADYCGSATGACDADFMISGVPVNVEGWTNKIGDYEGFTNKTFNSASRMFGCEVDASGACIGGFNSGGKSITVSKLGRIIGTPPNPSKENSYNVAGLAYFAHVTDLRPDLPVLPNGAIHNLTTFMIDTQEPASNMLVGPMNMLYLAAKYGGFNDMDGDGKPYNGATCGNKGGTPNDYCSEWDDDNDGNPDNYFFASDTSRVENSLNMAFNTILNRASSGTAAAVANNKSGERGANMIQAVFYPQWNKDKNIKWLGEVQGLWYYLDPVINYSGIYEDTDSNKELNLIVDKSPNSDPFLTVALWKAGVELQKRIDVNNSGSSDYRKIYTLLDASMSLTDPANAFVSGTTNLAALKNYLNVASMTDANAQGLINYLRGIDGGTYRSRTVTNNGITAPWKLGDVINSTPQVQSSVPINAYHIQYADLSYATYIGANQYKANNLVYAGANDGMLHAFKLGQVQKVVDSAKPFRIAQIVDDTDLGKEQWAFIPRNALPYMQYLSDQNYGHQYLVDGAPLLMDVSISKYSGCTAGNYWDCLRKANLVGGSGSNKNDYVFSTSSWKTVLVGSMGLGGATRDVDCNETLNHDSVSTNNLDCIQTPAANLLGYSSYFALDVTDSLNPNYMWELSDANLPSEDRGIGLTTPGVSIVRINATSGSPAKADKTRNGRWFAVFASGPTGTIDTATAQFLGRSDQNLKIYVVDLNPFDTVSTFVKGTNYWVFDTGIKYGFANSMSGASVDLDRSDSTLDGYYSDDAVYITYTKATLDSSNYPVDWNKGGVMRLITNNDPDPANWFVSTLIDNIGPVTTSIGRLQDRNNKKLWIYFGEGRYFYKSDNQTDGRRIFGIADPCYSYDMDHANTLSTTLAACPAITVNAGTGVPANLKDQTSTPNDALGATDKGWFINLDGASGINGSERVVSDVTASFNGIVFYTTLVPNSDACAAGGTTSLWAVKYNTGGTPPSGGLKGKAPLQTSSGGITMVDLGTAFTQRGNRKLGASLSPTGMAPKGRFPPLLQPKPVKQILNIQER